MNNEQILREMLKSVLKYDQENGECLDPILYGNIVDVLTATTTSDSDSTDAARYQYLKSQINPATPPYIEVCYWIQNEYHDITGKNVYGDELDEMVDAAIAATKKEAP